MNKNNGNVKSKIPSNSLKCLACHRTIHQLESSSKLLTSFRRMIYIPYSNNLYNLELFTYFYYSINVFIWCKNIFKYISYKYTYIIKLHCKIILVMKLMGKLDSL